MIDGHVHLWQLGQHGCTWPTPAEAPIYRSYGLDDLAPLAQAAGIEGVVLVQSQQQDADTDYLLSVAAHPLVKAVVGWVDLLDRAAPQRIRALASDPKLRSIRPMLQCLPDDDWICQAELAPAIAALEDKGLVFDALVFPRHLPYLARFARRYPGLPVVIDHAAKPPLATGNKQGFNAWCAAMAPLADMAQVYCKLSGLLTEAAADQGEEALYPYVDWLLANIGAERLLWGSDWPVVELAPAKHLAGYRAWQQLTLALLASCSPVERQAIMGGTARQFYQFSESGAFAGRAAT
ncbi:amidohydrolase family protein [Cellvibrio japonicus]|uniref:Amidohydrolase family superfamily n=1 Tax=Cellvibrio japonicus (strain Ueda107) TaxID=498211 RepID=B3PBR9_CELJU|nr:amidohydrolase family protein [Cellvibrio japonicus]ACE86132.1 Amidohydrolase family superfamily [Cellvibrio japonicus Ueda107]QEI11739.1 amidohydrolase family protein [Cellvibrio japonicus]QEI15313.1 amidohydrolase family protein [Cellvibrio japonicus]QEI18893.1 amidohydrolase family protein [Cellvibrio japonicus]